jgi:pimeloyl-ACP methyl ester carboxylesterase
MPDKLPIIYIRGYAGNQADVEETVDDPFYGFNLGSTHVRQDQTGNAAFFAFQSPFVRLARNHGYTEVFDGPNQHIGPDCLNPNQTIWIYRFYDPTSQTFDQPGGRRLSIEEAAAGLADFIDFVLHQPGITATRVFLIAHSMGGLVCRSLIQRHYPNQAISPQEKIAKLFTYGTPHGGISFNLGQGVIEKVRDLLGVNNSDDFGRRRMYDYLTPDKSRLPDPPPDFDPQYLPPDLLAPDQVFSIVGTNAHDYEVAHGLSRSLVGPQSDGLVQTRHAFVRDSPRAYIHRSHSGRYGMVNSEEGYQNLQRFLFGDVRVKTTLLDFDLNFDRTLAPDDETVTYLFELQVAIRGLIILLHEQTLAHLNAISVNENQFYACKANGLDLFTNFLISENARRQGTSMRYMLRLGLYRQTFRRGVLFTADHIEHLPLWSDYLILDLKPIEGQDVLYDVKYGWSSDDREPTQPMAFEPVSDSQADSYVDLPERGRRYLGPNARMKFRTFYW